MEKFPVDIVLATYNGASYIDVLIESILSQTHTPLTIYARDDGSTDNTYEKLMGYAEKFDHFIAIEKDKNFGVIKNFEILLQQTKSDYIFFADQDDFWFSDKVSMSVKNLKKIESELGSEAPALFFTDIEVVDQKLNKIADSFWAYENIQPDISQSLNKLIIRNVSPGCSMIFNRALLKKALPFPKGIVMHDWWLILTALVLGSVGYSYTPTMQYRQHAENVQGAKKQSITKKISEVLYNYNNIRRAKSQTQYQAKLLLDRFSNKMKEKDLEIVKAYSNYRKENKLMHKYRCYKNGISSNGLVNNLGLYLFL